MKRHGKLGLALFVSLVAVWCSSIHGLAQSRLAGVKALRCAFSMNATGTWKPDSQPDVVVKPATLVLVFESIDPDEGTARLRNGSAMSEVIARLAGGYLTFIQSFRSGPMYATT